MNNLAGESKVPPQHREHSRNLWNPAWVRVGSPKKARKEQLHFKVEVQFEIPALGTGGVAHFEMGAGVVAQSKSFPSSSYHPQRDPLRDPAGHPHFTN